MTKLFILVAATIFSLSASAADPKSIDFSQINLECLQVLNKNKEDSFSYKIKAVENAPAGLIAELEGESNSKMVSRLFELNEKSAFVNIYVYIGKTDDGALEFVEVFVSKNSSFVVDMNIVNVEKDHLDLIHGPSDDLEKYTAVSSCGNLFPLK